MSVVGNPPWDEVNVEELAFYALRDPGTAERIKLGPSSAPARVADLDDALHPEWRGEFEERQRAAERPHASSWGKDGGYELQGAGNTRPVRTLLRALHTTWCGSADYLGVVLPRSAFLTKGFTEGFRTVAASRRNVLQNGSMSCSNNKSLGVPHPPAATPSHYWRCSAVVPSAGSKRRFGRRARRPAWRHSMSLPRSVRAVSIHHGEAWVALA